MPTAPGDPTQFPGNPIDMMIDMEVMDMIIVDMMSLDMEVNVEPDLDLFDQTLGDWSSQDAFETSNIQPDLHLEQGGIEGGNIGGTQGGVQGGVQGGDLGDPQGGIQGGIQGGNMSAPQGGTQGGIIKEPMTDLQNEKESTPDYVLDPGCQEMPSSHPSIFLLFFFSLYIGFRQRCVS